MGVLTHLKTFDTDVAVQANTRTDLTEDLMRAISDIRMGAVDIASLRTLAMNPCSFLAATYSVRNINVHDCINYQSTHVSKVKTLKTSW
jgi:hypothetical protein